MTPSERLLTMLAERSAKRGNFTLASGRQSTLYVDCRLTTMSPDGLATIGPLGLAAIREAGWTPDAIGGLTLGADPVSYAIAHAAVAAKRHQTGASSCPRTAAQAITVPQPNATPSTA